MANRQTLPNMNLNAQTPQLSSVGAGQVVAPKWEEEKYKTLSSLSKGVVGISEAYKGLRHTEMAAKMDNIAQQELFKLQNVNDPSEIPNIVNTSYKAFDDMYKDDPYGKSFYNSELYFKFRDGFEANVIKESMALQKKFDLVQASRTANELSSDIALMTDPRRMSNAVNSYINQVKTLNLDPLEEEKLISQFTKDSFGKVFTNNPNNALNWYNASNGEFDKYGIDGNDIRDKADKYNKAKESERLTLENRKATLQKKYEDNTVEFLKAQVRMGKMSASDAQIYADEYSSRTGNLLYDALNKDEDLDTIYNDRYIKGATGLNGKDLASYNKEFMASNPSIPAGTRAYIKDYTEKTEKEQSFDVNVSKEQSKEMLNKAKIDLASAESVEDLSKVSNVYKDLSSDDRAKFVDTYIAKVNELKKDKKLNKNEEKKLNQSATYFKMLGDGKNYSEEDLSEFVKKEIITEEQAKNILSNQDKKAKELETQQKETFKQQSTQNLTDKRIELNNIKDNPEALAQFITAEHNDLTPEDRKALVEKGLELVNSFNEEQKKLYEDVKKKEQVKLTQSILNQIDKNQIPDDETLENLSYVLSEEQIKQIRSKKDTRLKEIKTENERVNNNNVADSANKAFSEGKTINVDAFVDALEGMTPEQKEAWRDKLIAKNKKVLDNAYETAYADVYTQIWKNSGNVSDETLEKLASDLSTYGKNKDEIYEDLLKTRQEVVNDKDKIKTNYHNQLETYWGTVTNKESDLEKRKKQEAKRVINALVDNGKQVDINSIINQFRPTPENVYQEEFDRSSAVATLETQRNGIFDYDEDLKTGISRGYVYKYDEDNVGGVFDFYNRVAYAKEKNHISVEKQNEYLKPIFDTQSKIIDEGLKNTNIVLGYVLKKVSTTLNPKGGIISYSQVFRITSDILNNLKRQGIDYNNSVTDRNWRIDNDVLKAQEVDILENTINSTIAIALGYSNQDSDVIVLSDGTEINNGSKK